MQRRRKPPKPYYSRKRKQWRARVQIGKRRFEAWFQTKSQAEDQIADWHQDRLELATPDGDFGHFVDKWLAAKECSPQSRRRYRFDLKHIEALRGVSFDRMRRKVVVEALAEIESPQTRNRVRGLLSQIMQAAIEMELIRFNPINDIRPAKVARKPVQVFQKDEVKRILGSVDIWTCHVALMLETGVRPGEAYALRWEDIEDGELIIQRTVALDERGCEVVQETPKTDAGNRVIPLSRHMIQRLAEHREAVTERHKTHQPKWIFGTYYGSHCPHAAGAERLKALLKRARVPYRNPHTCRHTAASTMLNGGVPLPIVAGILGHSSPAITLQTYSHLMDGDLLKARDFWEQERPTGA